jgi:hypothetical protein
LIQYLAAHISRTDRLRILLSYFGQDRSRAPDKTTIKKLLK